MSERIAWAAGFLEGEGCFGWYGKHNGYPLVAACQVEPEPIARLCNIFGVEMKQARSTSVGNPVWEFRVTSAKAIGVMMAVRHWMSDRRTEKIDECLDKWEALQTKRAAEAKRRETMCPHGHLWSEHGSRRHTGKNAGQRFCKACSRERSQRRRKEVAA